MKNLSKNHGLGELLCLLLLSGIGSTAAADTAAPSRCVESDHALIWTSPLAPAADDPMKVMAVATDAAPDELLAFDPDGVELPLDVDARGGPPWSLSAVIHPGRSGRFRVEVWRDGRVVSCRDIGVGTASGDVETDPAHSFLLGWDLPAEALYSAWIERLFDAPQEEAMSFPSLQPVLRDPERNFLHDYWGSGEDRGVPAAPDCADLPYVLRSYFAWKTGLPVAYRACDRGNLTTPPRCAAPIVDQRFLHAPTPVSAYKDLTRRLEDTVHSGNARTLLTADATDFYPVPLQRDALWPGTVYADPYGHTLLIVKWVPQTAGRPGMLLAVDAQPDNTVSRKRFWEGTFLFSDHVKGAGPGFKRFRPLLRGEGLHSPLRLLPNETLADAAPVARYSHEQAELTPEQFYGRMNQLINPEGLQPEKAYESMLNALVEQLETRADSVENGEDYRRNNPAAVITMPVGAAIFETTGPWEDYATPSRDMRLLIAMNVLAGLPQRIVRYPELFLLDGRSPEQARETIEQLHRQRLDERRIAYTRSDGSPWSLTLAEIWRRRTAFEVGYNPNDCAEFRWGAQPGTAEYATCRRRAPSDQRLLMEQYRPWFRDMRRPSR